MIVKEDFCVSSPFLISIEKLLLSCEKTQPLYQVFRHKELLLGLYKVFRAGWVLKLVLALINRTGGRFDLLSTYVVETVRSSSPGRNIGQNFFGIKALTVVKKSHRNRY